MRRKLDEQEPARFLGFYPVADGGSTVFAPRKVPCSLGRMALGSPPVTEEVKR